MYFFVLSFSHFFCEEVSKDAKKVKQVIIALVLAWSLEIQRGEHFDNKCDRKFHE